MARMLEMCVLDETLQPSVPTTYLVSMPGEVKDPDV